MNNNKHQHHKEHQRGIKDIDKHLHRKKITVTPLDILGNTENRPDENQDARCIQGVQVLLPGDTISHGLCGGMGGNSGLENDGADHEESEEENLDDETADDDVVSGVLRAVCQDSSSYSVVSL